MYLAVFISGFFIGSFLNVVADRSINGGSIFFGRSQCDFCKKALRAFDLIPIISFILLRARCRYCNKKLPLIYPLSELITGLVFFLIAYSLQIFSSSQQLLGWLNFVFILVVVCILIVLLLTDIKYMLIPNSVIHPAIVFVFLFIVFSVILSSILLYNQLASSEFGKFLLTAGYWKSQTLYIMRNFLYTLLSAASITVFFWFLTKIKNGQAMGGGDVKLALLIGLFNSYPGNILAIFLGFLSGAVFSIFLIMLRKKTVKDIVPFGPFLILGSFIALLWGNALINWYLNLFN